MFVLYAVLAGIVVGLLLGGSPGRLAGLHVRWAPLIVVGALVQVALFSEAISSRIGSLGPPIYVASMALVLVAVVRNARIPGLPAVAAGAASNLAAIAANGGYMPASAAALGVHATGGAGYSNSVVLADPALASLTDIFALPAWIPAANVFSVGDVAIAVGIVVAIVVQMRSRETIDIRDRMVRFGPLADIDRGGRRANPGAWAP